MKKDKSTVLKNARVSTTGRIISAALGSLLIYNSLSGKRSALKAIVGGYLIYRGASGHCPIEQALRAKAEASDIEIATTLTVNKPLDQTYRFWRNLSNLPLFMKHLKNVTEVDQTNSIWEATLPWVPGKLQWEAEIIAEKENELISWQSTKGSDIENSGFVYFKEAGKFGTEVLVHIYYAAPGGKLGELAAKLINPAFEAMVKEDIKNFRRYIESGEIPTTEGQPSNS